VPCSPSKEPYGVSKEPYSLSKDPLKTAGHFGKTIRLSQNCRALKDWLF